MPVLCLPVAAEIYLEHREGSTSITATASRNIRNVTNFNTAFPPMKKLISGSSMFVPLRVVPNQQIQRCCSDDAGSLLE